MRDALLMACLEANAYYNGRVKYAHNPIDSLLAEVYLMRAETLTKGVI